ncbi:MAG TPA: isoprenylcysteine carboxylmethyltransferase family protein [Gemmatimonadaceae bacterium]|nr:isoprenylcysteine carboxylmethyltransferase family protein [Gemmatimonadaceae bacterium]
MKNHGIRRPPPQGNVRDSTRPSAWTIAFVFIRALTYATLFIGFVLVFLPARVLSWSGIVRPAELGVSQVAGVVIGSMGAALALWCIGTFIVIGRGTPAVFDPPRRLVVVGPYKFVRNPMYIGAALALAGAALFYGSWALLWYCVAFALITHLFVVVYEEPTLRATFGDAYVGYSQRVHRWWPKPKRDETATTRPHQ